MAGAAVIAMTCRIADAAVIERSWSEREAFAELELAYSYLMMMLRRSYPMPPGLRRAVFEAIVQIPGVELIEGDSDARGRRGIGVTRPGNPLGWHLVDDPESLEYLGFRDTLIRDDGVKVTQVSAVVSHGVVDRIGQRP